jgi:hypothetical protein
VISLLPPLLIVRAYVEAKLKQLTSPMEAPRYDEEEVAINVVPSTATYIICWTLLAQGPSS